MLVLVLLLAPLRSEVLVHAAVGAANNGHSVFVLCPTGTLVHSYKDRLPSTELIQVETIHSGLKLYRDRDRELAQYSPPSRLRRFNLILIDEVSQVDDDVTRMLFMAFQELPQKPIVCLAADFRQLHPIEGGDLMFRMCSGFRQIVLQTVYRTNDDELLRFLSKVRTTQPPKSDVATFFEGRHFTGTLHEAVRFGLRMAEEKETTFSWLCVTNKGADSINRAALAVLGYSQEDLKGGYPGDPKIDGAPFVARVGTSCRLTRNLDKRRGFVNGALGSVHHVLSPSSFLVKLTTGNLVLVHPIHDKGLHFLPVTYGYATTIRRAQGSSLSLGCLFFNHCYPPERGYGYVAASRFRSKAGLFHFGRIRRTDWLPVSGDETLEQTKRSCDSDNSDREGDEEDAYKDLCYDSEDDDGNGGHDACRGVRGEDVSAVAASEMAGLF